VKKKNQEGRRKFSPRVIILKKLLAGPILEETGLIWHKQRRRKEERGREGGKDFFSP